MSDPKSPRLEPFEGSAPAATPGPVWPVLVATEEAAVSQTIRHGVAGVDIEGRAIRLLQAASTDDAYGQAAAEPALAVALIDPALPPAGGGLALVERLRSELGRRALRIVLYSGDDDALSLLELIRRHDIDDFWSASDLVPARIFVGLTTALRAFAQLAEIERQHVEWQTLRDTLRQVRIAEHEAADERARAELALRQAHQTLEACVEQRTRALSAAIGELDAFNRRVAQDLRGPLQGITGLSGLIQDGLDAGDLSQVRHWASMLEQQSRRLADLVAGLLSLSQLAQGDPRLSPVPLTRLAEEARDTLRLGERPEAAAAIRIAPDLPVLAVDPQLMRQAFMNLLDNALKFTRDVAAPAISVDATREAGHWLICVTDDGCGFPPEDAARLFEPFARLHGDAYPGAGIGLTVVSRIVEHHGGRIWAQGEPDRGARICFTLPADGSPRR